MCLHKPFCGMYKLIVIVYILILHCFAVLDQFLANCPHGCHCNKTTIECKSTNYHGTNFFLRMRPEIYKDLNTIVITSNFVGYAAGSNLFGMGVKHESVSLVNMSNDRIYSFDHHTFCGLPALQYFYLNNNSLQSVGADPFRSNEKLHIIDLSNVFAESLSYAERTNLLSRMFANSKHKFSNLQELILRDNALTSIEPNTFCNMAGLIRLHLSGNNLKAFTYDEECFPTLNVLDLSNNKFKSLPMRIWTDLPVLAEADISMNPLNCDCELMPFIQKIINSSPSPLNKGKTICYEPAPTRGQNPFEVTSILCQSGHYKLQLFAMFTISLIVVTIFIRTHSHKISLRLPIAAGYSKLSVSNGTPVANATFV